MVAARVFTFATLLVALVPTFARSSMIIVDANIRSSSILLNPLVFINRDLNTFPSPLPTTRVEGLFSTIDGTYVLNPIGSGLESITVPLAELSNVTSRLATDRVLPPTFSSTSGHNGEQTLVVRIQDPAVGDIGTIEVLDGTGLGSRGLSINGDIFSDLVVNRFILSSTSLTPDLLKDADAEGTFFRRTIGDASYTIRIERSTSFHLLGDFSRILLDAPPLPAVQGLNLTVTKSTPGPATLTLVGIAGAIFGARVLLRRFSAHPIHR